MKNSFFNKKVLQAFYSVLAILSTSISFFFLFWDIGDKYKYPLGVFLIIVLFIIYLVILIYANVAKSIKLDINNSEIEVIVGDIFANNTDLKVIAFNEYFDTVVDDKIIAKKSLNGIFVNKFYLNSVNELDSLISSHHFTDGAFLETNQIRLYGKKDKYKLGTISVVDGYLLTALTHFDKNEKAYLSISDYINCMMNFWNEIDIIYAGRTVALPILGSGITRIKNYEHISDQELLEIIIWTFKVSRMKFTYPSKVRIIIHKDKKNKINLLKLKDLEN